MTGSDLANDVLSEARRLPPLFPYLPGPVDTLMQELENLVSCFDAIKCSAPFLMPPFASLFIGPPDARSAYWNQRRTPRLPGSVKERSRTQHLLSLFPFAQLATVAFMVDQERLPGGIQRHLFAPVKVTWNFVELGKL